MKHALLLLLLSRVALADDASSVAVSNVTPTAVPATTCATCKSIMIENGGANAIYCSPESDVTVNTGFKVAPGDGWRSFPNVPMWCIAATAAQTGTNRDTTLVWVSQS